MNQEKRVVSWHIVPDDSLKHVAAGLCKIWAEQDRFGIPLANTYISDNINKEKSKPYNIKCTIIQL